jgi:inhibitor of cysteine peptidase
MKHSMVVTVLLLSVLTALALSAGGCDTGAPEIFRNADNPVYVNKGEEFIIALEANHTTGYSWQLTEAFDEGILELVDTVYEAPESDLMGAPGEEHWTFKAIADGRTYLHFAYVRPWETGAGTETESVTETVSETSHAASTEAAATTTGTAAVESETPAEPEETMTFTVDVGPAGSTTKKPKEYKQDSAGTPIEAPLGSQFALVLESNPTTGYRWQLADPLNESVVILISQEYVQTKATGENTAGAGGEETWTFRAVGEGETEISLKYVRSWEAGSPSDETVTFTVDVKKEAAASK